MGALIEHADGRTFVREGECDGCGGEARCCTFIELPLARALSEDERDWAGLHPAVSSDGSTIRIDAACSALQDGRCALFGDPERPAICGRSPELPEQVLAGCSYTLEEVVT